MIKYTVYKTTNLINGKIYIGVHKTDNPLDSYLGSGIYLKESIKLYGRENFNKIILAIFDNSKDAYEYERTLVNEDFTKRLDTYNIAIGGVPTIDCDIELIEKYKKRIGPLASRYGTIQTEETKQKISKSLKGNKRAKGHVHDDITREKISKSCKGRKLSEQDKINKSDAAKNREKITCPYCGCSSDPGNMNRWHFDKCKSKPLND